MPEFRLSNQAQANLVSIYEYSEQRFGAYQTEAYLAGLRRAFELLAEFPKMGRSADEVASGLRRFRFQSHYIVYRLEHDDVFIRAVIHVRRDLRPDLIE